jgi:hypothetical protein
MTGSWAPSWIIWWLFTIGTFPLLLDSSVDKKQPTRWVMHYCGIAVYEVRSHPPFSESRASLPRRCFSRALLRSMSQEAPLGFALPPHDELPFFLALTHGCARLQKPSPFLL